MDAKRLEELIEYANRWEAQHKKGSWNADAAFMHDLARCAKAWAKVERMIDEGLEFWKWNGKVRIETESQSLRGDTAIAAVEAAPEVGP